MRSKHKKRGASLHRLLLFASLLGLALLLLGKFAFDETLYVSLLQSNLLTIYAGVILAVILHRRQNPPAAQNEVLKNGKDNEDGH